MKRRWKGGAVLALGLALTLALAAPAADAAETPVTVVTPSGTLPAGSAVLRSGVTYISLRAVGEALGAQEIAWRSGRAEVSLGGRTLIAVPGEQYLTVGERCLYIPGGVELCDGTITVPLRAVAEAFGAEVSWTPGVATLGTPSAAEAEQGAYDEETLYWLSRVISAESRGEPLEGQIAVGNVVLNRVKSPQFPDTVYGVVFDRQNGTQFEPVDNGTIYDDPAPLSVVAAKLVLEGADTAGESLYFFAPALSQGTWIVSNRPYFCTIGCHQFYL